ncbi:dihydropteridine reductase [Thermus filiformis]|uniref:Dihydropteridine reductase n=1 Tax=Thermus filiformis TaxID=276 RepID=A0A0D6XB68_THEFI|nr:penicillin-binding transpeptidase domain-containing protein [Thermus filiformis]KIX84571.1 dihydropteridine reductase [Thermus filiformis]
MKERTEALGVSRVHLLLLSGLAYLLLLGYGVYALVQAGPRPVLLPPPSAPLRGNLYAEDGTPLALTLEGERFYPLGESMSQLLGFGERGGLRGLEGLEKDLEGLLSQGRSVTLTLDPWVQAMAERALWEGVQKSGAEFGSLVVLAPDGRLLAVANGPAFDPTAPRKDPSRDVSWRNHAFLVPLEPGSTMKALTAAMLLEEGVASLQTPVEAPMARRVDGWTINDVVPHPPRLTLKEVLKYSSNVGISTLAEGLKKERFFAYMEKLHLTDPRPLEGVRVARPLYEPPGAWSRAAYANHTFGQGFLITPLHLAAAFNALVDGSYHRPYLFPGGGGAEPVFSPQVAQTLRQALAEIAVPQARLTGYALGGKTGTAQVVVRGRYSREVYTAWFAGFVPADRPLATVVVALYHPKGQIHGSQVAAPVFRAFASSFLAYKGVRPVYAEGR